MNFNDYASAVSDLSVLMSKFDVTRRCNFYRVLKTFVPFAYSRTLLETPGPSADHGQTEGENQALLGAIQFCSEYSGPRLAEIKWLPINL